MIRVRNRGLLRALTVLSVLGFAGTLYLGLFVADTDIQQGEIQRIFYIHMPSFFGAFTAFGATLVGGIIYLKRNSEKWDKIALAGVEVGLAFALINLLTGAIWGAPDMEHLVDLGPALDLSGGNVPDLRGLSDVACRNRG